MYLISLSYSSINNTDIANKGGHNLFLRGYENSTELDEVWEAIVSSIEMELRRKWLLHIFPNMPILAVIKVYVHSSIKGTPDSESCLDFRGSKEFIQETIIVQTSFKLV